MWSLCQSGTDDRLLREEAMDLVEIFSDHEQNSSCGGTP